MTSSPRSPRWLFAASLVLQVAAFAWTGVMRYRNQRLSPQLFDFTQTGNVLAFAFLLAIGLACAICITRNEVSRAGAITLAAFSAVAVASLAVDSAIPVRDLDLIYSLYGTVQAVALGLASALASRDETHVAVRAGQHTGIIATFAFVGTIVYGIATPTDVPSTHRADAAVILGAAVWSHNRPSPLLRMRIAKANDLLRSTIVPVIVCTGGNALGERPEAEVERTELIKLGVDSSAIIAEPHSNSTIAQVMFLRDSLQARGFHSFVIVSDHFHLRRSLEMCRFNGLNVSGAASESLLPWAVLSWYRIRDAAATLLYWVFGA